MEIIKSRNWGQADKDKLGDLINRGLIDITDNSYQNIEQVRDRHFRHRNKLNFRRNFRDYSAAWHLEIEYSGARRRDGGKMPPPCPPPPPISNEEEVPGNEEGVDDTAAGADVDDDDDAAPEDAAPENDTMPPKLATKPPAAAKKATKKAESSDDVAAVPAPTTKPPANYSVDSTEKHFISYYVKGKCDVADVVFVVNGVVHDTEYRVTVAADRKSITLKRGVHSFCFSKKLLKAILGGKYSSSSHRAVAYDDIAQEMQDKNLRPENQHFWGAPQVVRLKWECTGTFVIIKRDYEIDYVNVDSKGRRNRQCNSVLIIQVKKAKERAETEAKVNRGQMSLFGSFSQGSPGSGYNPSPPPRRKSPRLGPPVAAAAGHRVHDDDEEDDDSDNRFGSSGDDEDDDDGNGGNSDGGGKRKAGV
jgi:hypothetical protein